MSSDKDEFNERLRRISETRAVTAGSSGGGGSLRAPPHKEKSGSSAKWMLATVLVLAVFGSIIALGGAAVYAKITEGPRAMLREVSATLQGANVQPAESGFIDKLADMIFPTSGDTAGDPIDFLPPAPDGWVRVTPKDAALPNALDAVKARWPQDSDVLPIDQNMGYMHLVLFLDQKAKPDAEQKVLSKTGTSAIYLGGDGQFLKVRLNYTSERSALGAKNDPDAWISALAAIEEKSLESSETLEQLMLGDIAATNQTKPVGESLTMRPIGSDVYATNSLKLAVPLSHRAILRMQGIATPILAQALIAAIDRKGLLAIHN